MQKSGEIMKLLVLILDIEIFSLDHQSSNLISRYMVKGLISYNTFCLNRSSFRYLIVKIMLLTEIDQTKPTKNAEKLMARNKWYLLDKNDTSFYKHCNYFTFNCWNVLYFPFSYLDIIFAKIFYIHFICWQRLT